MLIAEGSAFVATGFRFFFLGTVCPTLSRILLSEANVLHGHVESVTILSDKFKLFSVSVRFVELICPERIQSNWRFSRESLSASKSKHLC